MAHERNNSEFHDTSIDSHSASYSASPLIQPSPKPTRISFLPKVTRKMSHLFETPVPPSPPPTQVPPPSPDLSVIVDSELLRNESMEHGNTNDGAAAETSATISPQMAPAVTGTSGIDAAQPKQIRQRAALPREFKPSLVLKNSGSVARDHLGSERTFLAYVRTSLAIASTGVALVQLFSIAATDSTTNNVNSPSRRVQRYARPLGATTVCFGFAVLVFGVFRYFAIQKALTQGMFPVARIGVAVIAFALAVIVAVVFGFLV